MTKEQIYLQLFHRESISSPAIDVDAVDRQWLEREEYEQWLGTKSDIQKNEVLESLWIKSCTGGYITELNLKSDGTLDEFKLFDRLHTTGEWVLVDGMLTISIVKGDNRYQFNVIGSSENSIYSAIEYKNGELHSYLKVMPTRVR
ncbi:hypothetical protein L4C54_07450 [Vibrio lamellibrachiae]|uniref:hypothetical protein n=1 Tax=Vibrio lamellibrachiae TaxID=2910253 RepID=UPI003D0C41F3